METYSLKMAVVTLLIDYDLIDVVEMMKLLMERDQLCRPSQLPELNQLIQGLGQLTPAAAALTASGWELT
jgi:hypothetical protein